MPITSHATEQAKAADSSLVQSILPGDGEMARIMRGLDWSKTLLGPVNTWSPALRMMARFLLANRFPLLLWWGPQFCQLYNDAYRPILGKKHPQFVGRPVSECWNEIWHILKPLIQTPFEGGPATWIEDFPLEINRHGFLEETHFTVAYSPVPDETVPSGIGGVLATVHEISEKVVGERRTMALRDLGASILEERTPEEACTRAAAVLAKYPKDVAFALLYLLDPERKVAHLAASAGLDGNQRDIAPALIDISAPTAPWPVLNVIASGQLELVEDLAQRSIPIPPGAWSDPPDRAAVVPIRSNIAHLLAGFLIAGISPRLRFDELYRGFLELAAAQIATAVANARAYEEERRRAEALAELDHAKTLFFSNVSHELRTPLTLILGPLEEVLGEASARLNSEDRQQLEVTRRNALRLLRLVNTLLDFSRIEAGRVHAVYEPTDLARLTGEIASVFRSAMEKAGLHFVVECEPIDEPVYVDRGMWEKIVLNLLSNAFKFTFEGEVALTVKTINDSVELAVRDTGVGISQEEQGRIFERFHRIESTRARTYEGTGIGLALVHELVKLHGGSVKVDSTLGVGSTFRVLIPLRTAHLPADRIQAARTAGSTAISADAYVDEAQRWLPQESGAVVDESLISKLPSVAATERHDTSKRELIVVADDNADMRDYLVHLLRDTYHVHAASDGSQALEAIRRLRPSLVLADVMMPRLDGFRVLHSVRSDESLQSTPVILLSARAGEESRVEGLQAGADDYLVKPFTARELMARVATHIKMANLRREAADRETRLRAEAETALVASQRLAAIVESCSDAIISEDLTGIVTSWNPSAERIFGHSAEDMIGRPITTIVPPELYDDERRILATIAQGERIHHFETVRLTKGGERIDVALTLSPVRDEAGRIIGIAKIARDITQLKKAEQSLRTTERLASVGRLAATIAHEINNPLEAVTNLVYLAKERAVSQDVRKYLNGVEEELDRISHLTKQTLGFYRETKSPARVQVGASLHALLSAFATRASNKSIEIRPEIRQDPEIYAVPGEIRQLIANLVSNSIDAVDAGGRIRIRVSSTSWDGQPSPGIRITVADTGSGISQAVRSRLFEPFFTTKREVGTGLGLWVCKNIVEKHHGSIRMRSCALPGRSWTVFSVVLPLLEKESIIDNLRQAV